MKEMKEFDVFEMKMIINCKKKALARHTISLDELGVIYPNHK